MIESGERLSEGTKPGRSRILNSDLFLFLLDLEVKRARRYQNFLSIILMKLVQDPSSNNGGQLKICYKALTDLLAGEIRETDILASLGENRIVALLPYADASAGSHAKSRLESILKYYDFRGKGYGVVVHRFCFPSNGTDTIDLLRKALET